MTLVNSCLVRYLAAMRIAFALFAALAIFLSGTHAGPAEAHQGDPVHASTHHAEQHDDGGSSQHDGGDQHGCHHHCPSAAASSSDASETVGYFASLRLQPANMSPLTSTTRAPLLNPPKG